MNLASHESGPEEWAPALAALVDEVNADAIDGASVVVEGRQFLQLRLPVELIFPVLTQPLHELEIDAVRPARAAYFIGPAGAGQAQAEIFDRGFGIRQRERFNTQWRNRVIQYR